MSHEQVRIRIMECHYICVQFALFGQRLPAEVGIFRIAVNLHDTLQFVGNGKPQMSNYACPQRRSMRKLLETD